MPTPITELKQQAMTLLAERGIKLEDLAELVMFLQNKYITDLSLDVCLEHVQAVLEKREVLNTIVTGIEIDKLAEQNKLSQPLNNMLMSDEGLYGIDEIMALSIVNVYGTIGFTNYGYIDKVKPGIIKELDTKKSGSCHTFLDDIVGAIAAAAASRLAHSDPSKSAIANRN